MEVNILDASLDKFIKSLEKPTIAKVLLTKHGYREGIDQTTNDKDLPTPILGGVSVKEGKKEFQAGD